MKKLTLMFLITCFSIAIGYTKTVTTEDGFLSFEIPEKCGCVDIYHRNPRKLEIAGYCAINFRDNINSYGRPLYELLIKDNLKLKYDHVKELLLSNDYIKTGDFTLDPNYRINEFSNEKQYIGYLPRSYKPIIRDDVLGEEYMYAPLDSKVLNKYGGGSMDYNITFVLSDRLERISFGRIIIDGSSLVNSFPQWFEMRSDGNYYWINQECLDQMYDLLFSDDYKKLPRDLQLIRETRDMILNTVRINNPPVDTSKLKEGVITH